jgi:hypothetical protein
MAVIYFRKKRPNFTWRYIVSDSRRRYCAVKAKLRQLAPDLWMEWESRMTNLSLMVSAIVKAKDLTQHAMAAEMPVSAQDTSLAQRQRRWLMNEHVDEWAWYRALSHQCTSHSHDATPLLFMKLSGS